jgi:hypothetical protein
MIESLSHGRIFCAFLVTGLVLALPLLTADESAKPSPGFWIPRDPPGAEYRIEAGISSEGESIDINGSESITLVNSAPRPLTTLAFEWTVSTAQGLDVKVDGRPLRRLNDAQAPLLSTPILYELPAPLGPGRKIRLEIGFTFRGRSSNSQVSFPAWYPRLWWEGIPVRDSFKVKFTVPPGYVLATSGRLDPRTGYYENDCVTTRFGLFLSNTLRSEECESDGILIRALFTDKGQDCARLCLDTAADIIKFYRRWLGVYPHKSLCIIPGGPQPWGGYPFASAIVVIHGQETYDAKKGPKELAWWKWITAHEIGHQYWGEFVMPGDVRGAYTDSWFMVGMGISADKTYLLARNMGWERHRGFIDGYLQGVKAKNDTTMDAPSSLAKTQKFDTNNIVIHGKGFTVISALETVLGKDAFDGIYRRTVASSGGKRLGWRDFRRICEETTGQDLGWFFEDWVRSNRVLECRIASQTSNPGGSGFVSEVRVEYGLESIRMPVPVGAVFEDGSSQVQWTDRFARVSTLRFESRSRLKEAELDPEGRLAVIKESPAKSGAELTEAVENLDWTGTGEEALAIFQRPEAAEIKDAQAWFKLGLLLFDGRHYPESFEAFKKCAELDRSNNSLFGALVWMGNIKDLLGDRDAAVGYFREALKHNPGWALQHDQYGLRIDKAWVEERLKTPFKWDR